MNLGPFIRREFVISRRRNVLRNYIWISILESVSIIVVGFAVWGEVGSTRATLYGRSVVGLVTFGLLMTTQGVLAVGLVLGSVARSILVQRDTKSLETVLSTPLSSAELVFGTMSAALVRYALAAGASIPIVIAFAGFWPIDLSDVFWGYLLVAALAFATAGLAVAISVEGRSSRLTLLIPFILVIAWNAIPLFFVITRTAFLRGQLVGLTRVASWLLDSSPVGLVLSLVATHLRPGGFATASIRLVCWETLFGVVLAGWSTARLRPTARARADSEAQSLVRRGRFAHRRLPRKACGDDPVLWNEISASRGRTAIERNTSWFATVVCFTVVAYTASWFARPAFAELTQRGYGAFPEGFTKPAANPFARVATNSLSQRTLVSIAPGQARLEFNIALRQFSVMIGLLYVGAIAARAGRSIESERKRDTWLGLLATPLSGWEILRAKMLGSLWKARAYVVMLLALWLVGLATGALHPLGFAAGIASLALLTAYYAALGVFLAIAAGDPIPRNKPRSFKDLFKPPHWSEQPAVAACVSIGIPFFGGAAPIWLSLFSFEDVRAIAHPQPYPFLFALRAGPEYLAPILGLVWFVGTLLMAAATRILMKVVANEFDRAVGRPSLLLPERPIAWYDIKLW